MCLFLCLFIIIFAFLFIYLFVYLLMVLKNFFPTLNFCCDCHVMMMYMIALTMCTILKNSTVQDGTHEWEIDALGVTEYCCNFRSNSGKDRQEYI